MFKKTTPEKIIQNYCKKFNKKEGCKWFARRNKALFYIKITETGVKTPDSFEFLERDKVRKHKLKDNIKIVELKYPIMIIENKKNNKYDWYEITDKNIKKTKKNK